MNVKILETAIQAGKAILKIYNDRSYDVDLKEDQSPLTTADLASNRIINENLSGSGYPVLSEENKSIPYEKRKDWQEFFLVDPLDGTKEFIKRNGEFTVNIALIRDGIPASGVIYAPVPDILYWGSEENGSWKLNNASGFDLFHEDLYSHAQLLPLEKPGPSHNKTRVVASKSHFSQETEDFIQKITASGKETELVSKGSSLKLCLVAEGSADVYPRLGPTMEWDTGAGHAIAKFAGCRVVRYDTGEEMRYNKEDLRNPWFIVENVHSQPVINYIKS